MKLNTSKWLSAAMLLFCVHRLLFADPKCWRERPHTYVMVIDSEQEIMTRLPGNVANSNMCKLFWKYVRVSGVLCMCGVLRRKAEARKIDWVFICWCWGNKINIHAYTHIFGHINPRFCDMFRHFSIVQTENSRFVVPISAWNSCMSVYAWIWDLIRFVYAASKSGWSIFVVPASVQGSE